VAAEPQAAAELARLCGYLPLALRIAAANLTDGNPIAGYVAGLARDDRLGELQVDGDGQTAVRAAFDRSYHSLPEPAQRMFRRLSLAPGPDAGVPTAAALAGTTPVEARSLLDRLTAAHLVDQRRPGRYSHHDLLRVYAAELVDTDERRAAIDRMLDHLLHAAHGAALLLYPHRDVVPLPPPAPGLPLPELPDAPTALAWFTAEYAGLVNAVRLASTDGHDAHAWQLAWTMTDYLYRQGHWHEMAETQRIGLAAAQRTADRAGQARLQRGVANAYIRLGRHDEAHTHLGYALDLYGAVGDQAGQARTHLDLGSMSERRGRVADAIEHGERALELSRTAGYDAGQARALNATGWFRALNGDHSGALTRCEQALELQRRLGDRYGEANTQDSLGYIWQQLGDVDKAIRHYRLSIEAHRAIGSRAGQAVVSGRLGDAYAAAGDPDVARDLWRYALDVLDELGHLGADDLRTKLG
jgi:tetratricopeptide (TPR) repeat protein